MSNRLKILCFHPALAPYRVDLFNILSEFSDLTVVFLQENLQTQLLDQGRIRDQARFRYRFALRGFTIKGRIFRFGLNQYIRDIKPDVVIGFEFSPVMVLLCLSRLLLGGCHFKLWTTTDDRAEQARTTNGLRKVFRNWILRHVNGCIVTDATVATVMRECVNGIDKVSFAAVPIVHDTAHIRTQAPTVIAAGRCWRESLALTKRDRLLLFVGRLVPVKNLTWLISQIALISPNVHLVIVGDGIEEALLKETSLKLGIVDRVKFLGRKEGCELYTIMSAVDALVLCSHSEAYGAVVAEALQWGTPCIVNDRCGASVLINNSNGRVFRYNDGSDFESKLNEVFLIGKAGESLLPVDLRESVVNLVKKMYENA